MQYLRNSFLQFQTKRGYSNKIEAEKNYSKRTGCQISQYFDIILDTLLLIYTINKEVVIVNDFLVNIFPYNSTLTFFNSLYMYSFLLFYFLKQKSTL